jgi:Protein of unknown function (DUF2804)
VEAVPASLDLSTADLPLTLRGTLAAYSHVAAKRRFSRKRWYYLQAATEHLLAAAAIVDLGYASKAFFYVVDKNEARFLAHHSALMPGGMGGSVERPSEARDRGERASVFRSPLLAVRVKRTALGAFSVRASSLSSRLELRFDPAAEPIVAAAHLKEGGTHLTEKNLSYIVRGFANVGGRIHDFSGGCGSSDFSDGIVARHTTWRWVSFSGYAGSKRIGLNLVQGFLGAPECTLWIDGGVEVQGEAIVDKPANPTDAWHIRTSDGRIDLRFTPICVHEERTNLWLVKSQFVQPVGSFSGVVKSNAHGELRLEDILGVCEDQDVVW